MLFLSRRSVRGNIAGSFFLFILGLFCNVGISNIQTLSLKKQIHEGFAFLMKALLIMGPLARVSGENLYAFLMVIDVYLALF